MNAENPILEIIGTNGGCWIRIFPDLHIEFGPQYQPDEIARLFWDSIEQFGRLRYTTEGSAKIKVDAYVDLRQQGE